MKADKHESYIIDLLRQQGHEVIDVRNLLEYQRKDIDIIINNINIEIKTDNIISKTGNIFAELYSHKLLQSAGWLYKSKAEEIYYYDINNDILYSIPLKTIQEYVATHKDVLRKASGGDNALGYLIPICNIPHTIIFRGIPC